MFLSIASCGEKWTLQSGHYNQETTAEYLLNEDEDDDVVDRTTEEETLRWEWLGLIAHDLLWLQRQCFRAVPTADPRDDWQPWLQLIRVRGLWRSILKRATTHCLLQTDSKTGRMVRLASSSTTATSRSAAVERPASGG